MMHDGKFTHQNLDRRAQISNKKQLIDRTQNRTVNAKQIEANDIGKNKGKKGNKNKEPNSSDKQSKGTNFKERWNNPTNRNKKVT